MPRFEVDSAWPKLPAKWVFGQVSSVSIDEQRHAWIVQRASTNLYVTEVQDGKRAQKFVFKGYVTK